VEIADWLRSLGLEQYENAFRENAIVPESSERDEKLAFQIALQTPLFAARFGSAEGERAAQRAVELSRKVASANQRPLVRALFGLSLTYSSRGQIRSGREVAEELLVVAECLQEPETLAYAHHVMGNTLFWFAELGRAGPATRRT
jgi:hypothetical protein